jgi:hypothetical protein
MGRIEIYLPGLWTAHGGLARREMKINVGAVTWSVFRKFIDYARAGRRGPGLIRRPRRPEGRRHR